MCWCVNISALVQVYQLGGSLQQIGKEFACYLNNSMFSASQSMQEVKCRASCFCAGLGTPVTSNISLFSGLGERFVPASVSPLVGDLVDVDAGFQTGWKKPVQNGRLRETSRRGWTASWTPRTIERRAGVIAKCEGFVLQKEGSANALGLQGSFRSYSRTEGTCHTLAGTMR